MADETQDQAPDAAEAKSAEELLHEAAEAMRQASEHFSAALMQQTLANALIVDLARNVQTLTDLLSPFGRSDEPYPKPVLVHSQDKPKDRGVA